MKKGCFSGHAVVVCDSYCKRVGVKASIINPSSSTSSAFSTVQPAITNVYNCKDALIKVTWAKTLLGRNTLSLSVDLDPHNNDPPVDFNLSSKKRSKLSFASGPSQVRVHWDYSAAKFDSIDHQDPEALSNFFIVVIIDNKVALRLGDGYPELLNPLTRFSLVARRELVLLSRICYTTRVFPFKLCLPHAIQPYEEHVTSIFCEGAAGFGGDDITSDTALVVRVDERPVVEAKNILWNLRGNKAFRLDGTIVDVMWDIHGWISGDPDGCASFMFRRRSDVSRELHSEEELIRGDRGTREFSSFLIQIFKTAA